MPLTLFKWVRQVSGLHQCWLAGLSALLFAVGLAPLEVQRRIVNDAVAGGNVQILVLLAAAYFGLGVAEGLLKLGMNVYRGWVSENAVRWLRTSIASLSRPPSDGQPGAKATGTEIAMTLSEAEPIGNFAGSSVSEPFLQGGILVSVFAYMVYLQPLMALVAFGVFFPQFLLVPLMQRALNRRVGVRIWTLRKISTGLVDDESRGESTLALQSRRVDRVFDLNMGIYKIKFSLNFAMNLLQYAGMAGILGVGAVMVTAGRTDIGTVVAFAAGLAKINDPWGDLVTWYRDYRVVKERYRLVSAALQTAPIPGDDVGTAGNLPRNWAKAGR
jgi:ABC-type bacteriocin/lantibiotic exporter with double-glycine peptidase domain